MPQKKIKITMKVFNFTISILPTNLDVSYFTDKSQDKQVTMNMTGPP